MRIELPIPADPVPVWLRQKPAGGDGDGPGAGVETEERSRDAEVKLYCAACGTLVTRGRWRISAGGSHEHVFFNPGGQLFRVVCFKEAPGAVAVGEPTDEFTWFRGYDWQVALCHGCTTQLGWQYSGEGPPAVFFGLIQNKLTDQPPSPT